MFSYLYLPFAESNRDEFEKFCSNFDILLNNINDELPLCSIVTVDFNSPCSRWWKNYITNLQGQELDSLTLSVGYNQIIDKSTPVINNSMPCIDLIFCTNQSGISNHGVGVSFFDKCYLNLIYGKTNIRVPLLPIYVREKVTLREQCLTLIGIKLLKIFQ